MKATSHYEYDPNIIACLDKLGFKYSVTPKSKKLKISLSDKISLFRKGFNSWFKNESYIYSPTKAVELSTSEFISLLRIIAKTSMVEGKYPYVHIGREEEFIAGLKPILKYCIPGNCYALDYPWINIYFDKNAKDGFRWSRNRANWLSIFFYVIQNYEFIKGILHSLEQMEFPNVKIIIKNTGQ